MQLPRAAVAACTLYFIFGQDALHAQSPPAAGQDFLQVIGVTLMPVGGRSHVAVGVGNRGDRPLWLRITVDAGMPVLCEGERVALHGMKIAWFMCPVDPIVAGRVYPVQVEVYRDEWDEEPGDVRTVRPAFTVRDVHWLQSQLEP